ncbi:MAG: hypothetical protein KAT66_03610 [Candidatus Lokiarchaeota archaeon]|nr:hypothetical protein [Candidatus Lokiarchaeota archaeon]
MKLIKDKVEYQKVKKGLLDDLKYYNQFIIKKIEVDNLISAINKVKSAITLIEEYQNDFNLINELSEFKKLSQKIDLELRERRRLYLRRYNNLLKEKINESNLENFMKLLAMLKNEVDNNLSKFNLEDIHNNINKYFVYIKRIYEILSCCEILNYYDVSEKIFNFVNDLKSENFPNLKFFVSSIYKNLITKRLFEFSKEYNIISISTLSKRMAIKQEYLIKFIDSLKKQPKAPIIDYNPSAQVVTFKKSRI